MAQLRKDVQLYLAQAYNKASMIKLNQTPKKMQLPPKTKSETQLKNETFYFVRNVDNSQKKVKIKQQDDKQFVIRKTIIKESNSKNQQLNDNWSGSDDEKPVFKKNIKLHNEMYGAQRESRIQFLQNILNLKFEIRNNAMEFTKKPIQYPTKAIVIVQANWKRKLQKQRYKTMKEEYKRKQLKLRENELICKIQHWFRALKKRWKWIEAAYKLLQFKRRIIYPKKQNKYATKLQSYFKNQLTMDQKNIIYNRTPILRKKIITFEVNGVQDKIQNKIFYFSLKVIDDKVIFKLQIYATKKCDRKLLKPLTAQLSVNEFISRINKLIEYEDILKADIEINYKYLGVIQTLVKLQQEMKGDHFIFRKFQNIPFEDLLYIDDDYFLQVAGITDFKYSEEYEQQKEQQVYVINNLNKLHASLKFIIEVQTIYRQRRAINIMRQKTNRRRHIQKTFGINFSNAYAQVFINQDNEIFAKVIYDRRWIITNKLKINKMIEQQLGFPNRENFFDAYQIINGKLEHSEEGQYWIQKEETLKNKKKILSFSQIELCIRLIQSCIRRYLSKKQVEIKRQSIQLLQKKQIQIQSLAKRVILQNSNPIRAYFMNFILKQEIEDEKIQYSINIEVKALEHHRKNEYIYPYTQLLFYNIPINELIIIGQRMMTIGKVEQFKGIQKFMVQNLMEVQGSLEQEKEDENVKKEERKEDTLKARKMWNKYMREQWVKNGILFENVQQETNQTVSFSSFTKVKDTYKQQKYKNNWKIYQKKDVIIYNQESISDYVRLYKNKSIYGYGNELDGEKNLNFLQIRLDEQLKEVQKQQEDELLLQQLEKKLAQEEAAKQQKIKESIIQFYQNFCIISEQRIQITIKHNKLTNQFEINGKLETNQILEYNISINEILSGRINIDFLKEKIEICLLKQLQIQNNQLIFQPDYHLQEQVHFEEIKWQQQFDQMVNSNNVEGNLYGLNKLFKNIEQPILLTLQEYNYQAFELYKSEYQNRTHEYLFNLSLDLLFFTVYFHNYPKKRKTHMIKSREFESQYVLNIIKQGTPDQIIKLFTPFAKQLDDALIINEDFSTNICDLNINKLFLQAYVFKIERLINIRQQFQYYQMYRKRDKTNIYITRRHIQIDNKFIEAIFYLNQYVLKIVFLQISQVDGNGYFVENKQKCIHKLNLLEQDLSQFEFSKWLDNQDLHLPRYYEKQYGPLIDYIIKSISVIEPFEIIFNSEFKVEKPNIQNKQIQHKNELYAIIKACLKLQNNYKKLKQLKLYQLLINKKKRFISTQIGKHFQTTYKIIDNIYYQVNMYEVQSGFETTITVELFELNNKKKIPLRGIYIYDSTEMLNIGQISIQEYILNLIYINNGMLEFGQKQMEKFSIHIDEQSIEETDKIQSNIIDNQVINHYREIQTINNPQIIYNAIYTGNQPAKIQQLENTIKLDVDLSKVKTLYPNLKSNDDTAIKTISEVVMKSIQINNDGNLLVDKQRINPEFIKVSKSNIQLKQIQSKPLKPISSITLAKKKSYYSKQNFLMKVCRIERKIAQINNNSVDETQEYYEVLYSVQAILMGEKDTNQIEWELSLLDAQQLTHQTNKNSIAQELIKRTMVVGDKFIYLVIQKSDIQRHHYTSCILFLEKAIKPIQKKFRYRKQIKNYNDYKKLLFNFKGNSGQLPENIYHYIDNLKSSQYFIVLAGEYFGKIIFICWNIETFNKMEIEIPKFNYQEQLMKNKSETIKELISYVDYINNQLIFNPPRPFQTIVKIRSQQFF